MFELSSIASHGFVVMVYKAFGEEIGILAQNLPPGPMKSMKQPFGHYMDVEGHWNKGQYMNITPFHQLFLIYMTYIPPQTSPKHP